MPRRAPDQATRFHRGVGSNPDNDPTRNSFYAHPLSRPSLGGCRSLTADLPNGPKPAPILSPIESQRRHTNILEKTRSALVKPKTRLSIFTRRRSYCDYTNRQTIHETWAWRPRKRSLPRQRDHFPSAYHWNGAQRPAAATVLLPAKFSAALPAPNDAESISQSQL